MDSFRPYPLLLSARAKQCLWGNPDWAGLADLALPDDPPVGELWLNDDRPGGSRVLNGPLAGTGLDRLVEENPRAVLGSAWAGGGRFPILIKFLNTSRWLSIQVHPDAERYGAERSKAESWHILKAPAEPSLIMGLKEGTDRRKLKGAIRKNRIEKTLNRFPVRPGQTLFIPGGLVHSLGPGLLLFEIQQNNDITFRLHDWNRLDGAGKPRPLHVEKSLEAIRYDLPPARPNRTVTLDCPGGTRTYLSACSHFMLSRLDLDGEHPGRTREESFLLLTALRGRGLVEGQGERVELEPGGAVLIPAALDKYRIIPDKRLTVLESRAPDLVQDLVGPLKEAGIQDQTILGLAGPRGRGEIGPALSRWEGGPG